MSTPAGIVLSLKYLHYISATTKKSLDLYTPGRYTDLVSTEERPRLAKANLTHGVFQVRVNLDLRDQEKPCGSIYNTSTAENQSIYIVPNYNRRHLKAGLYFNLNEKLLITTLYSKS